MSENNKPKKQINWEVVFAVGAVAVVGSAIALNAYVSHSKAKANQLYMETTAKAYDEYLKIIAEKIVDGTVKITQETIK